MDEIEVPAPDEDCVESFLMTWGLGGFAVGVTLLCVAGFYVARLIASFLFPGANP